MHNVRRSLGTTLLSMVVLGLAGWGCDGSAEEPDAGATDAGSLDAGLAADSGPPDAGPPDAGPPDAGPPDPCETAPCDANADCDSSSGTAVCTCRAGYTGDGVTCANIDECTDGGDDCDANATCTDTDGGWDCTCNPGYTGDGVTCTNIDECTDGGHDCISTATCTDTPGGWDCTCNPGYTGDGLFCTNIDECTDGGDDCDANATCTDTDGGWECACNSGFTGDGTDCTALPVVDQFHGPATPNNGLGTDSTSTLGQTFTAGATGTLSGVEVSLHASEAVSATVQLEIFSQTGTSLGSVMLTTTLNASSPALNNTTDPTPGAVFFDVSSLGVRVESGTAYRLQLSASIAFSGRSTFFVDGYAGGELLVGGVPQPELGGGDVLFKTVVIPE